MIIAPLVFSLLLTGIAKVGDFNSVGRIGLKTMIYFTAATIIALVLGLVIVNIFEPGKALQMTEVSSSVVQAKEFNGKISSTYFPREHRRCNGKKSDLADHHICSFSE